MCSTCGQTRCCCDSPTRYNGPDIPDVGIETGTPYDAVIQLLGEFVSDIEFEDGVGISGISWTSNSGGQPQGTQGTTDTYTITLTDNSTYDFVVTNGADGADGIDGIDGIDGVDGVGISNIAWTSNSGGQPQGTQGTTDTYTITLSDASTYNFVVTNGADGIDGIDGADGNLWTSAAGVPVGAGVNIGDQYLNTTNGDVYEWDGATWNITGNIQGPSGGGGTTGGYTPDKYTNIGGITIPAVVGNHHIIDNGHPSNPTTYELPDTANIGDMIKFTVLDGACRVKSINAQVLTYGLGPSPTAPVDIAAASWFAFGEGESLEVVYVGQKGVTSSEKWIITNFQTNEVHDAVGTNRVGI